LQGIVHKIVGCKSSQLYGHDALYYEYDNEHDATQYFQRLTEKYDISPEQAAVLVRSISLKTKINNKVPSDFEKHYLLNAIQLWRMVNPENRTRALQILGLQMQKWLNTQGRKDNYYCPTSLCSSVFRWRLVLRDILNDLTEQECLCSFNKSTYSKWYSIARSAVEGIVDKRIQPALGLRLSEVGGISLRAPSGTASKEIYSLVEDSTKAIRAETIHSVKGKSYEAVMLLSTPNASGKTGYWENWLNDKGEVTRFAYVACTRPQFLLCWAVKKLSNEQRTKIESLGLTRLVID
jgi:DNA helicase-2/ATP-dependent DNA helicase PcrA